MDIYNDISLSTGSSYMAENDGLKQTFPQRRCADGQEAHEKVLSIADHWRTANQNYSDIPPQTSQNSYHQKSTDNKCWRECGLKERLLHFLPGCNLVQPLQKTVCRFIKKLKIELPHDSTVSLLGIYLENTSVQKDTCTPKSAVPLFTNTWGNKCVTVFFTDIKREPKKSLKKCGIRVTQR